MTNQDRVFKSRDITLPTKLLVQCMELQRAGHDLATEKEQQIRHGKIKKKQNQNTEILIGMALNYKLLLETLMYL